ncbi:aldehyde dehydrogenase EutE [Schinkia azotoformans]|uniref:Aldehyde dehydrogenase EutE n=1 Tax=Schinkia azotoformans LMG 9581 TaxID=1131731 RepID=K6CW52_SCHAZ|nr:aldehyde dehydrogenase family protein [Schinkia azotoformans]EKN64472.1 aldehyde dehydrogenase EutE [Schinkia azotoformans LMG 9581]MEC1640158.1 aldehyde dehydrogenase EutE [Schinkia azotoformans]MEC1722502.1 aldehyde dehydrogenase EutE [Schinkia azotoformans]MEC1945535.1 aldehyde dehydrogenase EutE [Schinkia azotoformans]MED4415474.1 aldehyde dehydrogenase EutE [Schinkia azotoformans]
MAVEAKAIEEIVKKILEEMMIKKDACITGYGIFEDMNEAIEAATIAQKELLKLSLEQRGNLITAIRKAAKDNAETFAQMAVDETGMGNYGDKVIKNLIAAEKTPGIEDLTTEAFSGDHGLTLVELSPYGVIGSITPTTNPTETVICNSIGMIAAGNAVVFSPHPTAKNTSLKAIEVINKAIIKAGGPPNLITSVANPTIDQANIMMKHKKIKLLVATGGPGVVKAVLSSGKKAIGAGAGNPPAVVDETANLEKAARDIIDGCSFDNNLPCTAEKEVIVVDSVADYLVSYMKKHGAFLITDKEQIQKLTELVVDNGHANKELVGKSVAHILQRIGIEVPSDARVAILNVERNHPLVKAELMMPILPVVRVENVDAAIELAVEAEQGFRHTAIMHSTNIDNLTKFSKEIQTTIFVKNGPSYAGIGIGGEGYATFTIAGPTGEGLTSAKDFARRRKCVLVDGLSIR